MQAFHTAGSQPDCRKGVRPSRAALLRADAGMGDAARLAAARHDPLHDDRAVLPPDRAQSDVRMTALMLVGNVRLLN